MAFSDYSSTPSANTSIAGQNISPGGPPSAVGPGIRQLMADGAGLLEALPTSVIDQGADPTGANDSRAAFLLAASVAGVGGCVRVPRGTYKINDVVDILEGQTWKFEGATLTHADDTKTILRADGKSNWAIEGNVILQGLLTVAATSAETGLRITNCNRYRVSGVSAIKFKGKGIFLDGATGYAFFRGARGQFTDCATHECTVGLWIDPGGGAEYNTWTNFTACGNTNAVRIGAGNNIFLGGNIVDNVLGVCLVSGSNHGHGMFVGTNINHNTDQNVYATGITNGYTFIGCHFYGNTAGTASGAIWLDGCKGIVIQGGIIDCWIANDLGTGSGLNKVLDNYFPDDYGVQLFTSTGGLGQLYLRGNYLGDGESELNDPAPVYVDALRASSSLGVPSATSTVLVFNSEVRDKGAGYDNTTGIFTAPVTGFYEIEVNITITAASGLTAAGYATVLKNGVTEWAYGAIVPLSGTIAVGEVKTTVLLSAGDTLKTVALISGTTPVLATDTSRLTIKLRG